MLPSYLPEPFGSAGFGTFPFQGVAGHRRASPSAALDKKSRIQFLVVDYFRQYSPFFKHFFYHHNHILYSASTYD
jgi:hypothetical protein